MQKKNPTNNSKTIPQPIEAVLFDLDGTLIDTAPTFSLLLNQLLKQHQRPTIDKQKIRTQVSHGAGALITMGFGVEMNSELYHKYRNELLDMYLGNIAEGSELFSGMNELLKAIEKQNIPWGIVTNKPTRFTFPLLHALNLNERCSVVVCPDDVTLSKPSAEPMYLASTRLNVNPKHCIYIGDHERDIAAGNAADMFTISALYGYIDEQDSPDQWQADQQVQTTNELFKILNT